MAQMIYADLSETCQRMTAKELAVHYGTSINGVRKALFKRRLSALPMLHPNRAATDGIEIHCRTETIRQLAERYSLCPETISRKLSALGLKAARAERPRQEKTVRPTRAHVRNTWGAAPRLAYTPTTEMEAAAEYLRRFGPVIRCREDGHYHPQGQFYRRGTFILNAAEIVAAACRNGWNPDAWKKVA